jgi:predicted HNH restriction endonuclease
MTQRQQDFTNWLSTQEFAGGRKYSQATIKLYPNWLDSRFAQIFNIPNLTSVFNILDVNQLKKLENKYLGGNLSKSQQDLRSALHKYILFCQNNESNFTTDPFINDNPDFLSKTEGGKKVIISVRSERDSTLRKKAIKLHGLSCQVCSFNFETKYGKLGKDFIEVHHAKPLHENNFNPTSTNPKTDLNVVCSNCHRMLHRKKGITLTIDELRQKL